MHSSTGNITVRTQSSVCDFLKLTSLRYRPSIGVSQTYRNINRDVSHRQRNVIYSVRARMGLWEPCPLCGTGAETLVRVWGFAPKVNRTFFAKIYYFVTVLTMTATFAFIAYKFQYEKKRCYAPCISEIDGSYSSSRNHSVWVVEVCMGQYFQAWLCPVIFQPGWARPDEFFHSWWSSPAIYWLHGPAVEHRSLAGVLSLPCARPVADGWPLMWVNHLL